MEAVKKNITAVVILCRSQIYKLHMKALNYVCFKLVEKATRSVKKR